MKNETKNIKQPWPTQKAMEQIYEKNLWGSNATEFYSGEGSHHPDIVNPYIEAVISFLSSFKNPVSVCDLGCGDFNIGKQLLQFTQKYTAVDIVPSLIAFNNEKFKAPNLEFHCLDIATADLPAADCVLLRQVLQHLSNAEVQCIVEKLANYKYVILTEHLPKGDFIPNVDIISGQGIRIKKQSGVCITAPPFGFKCINEKQLVATNLGNEKGIVVTILYTVF